MSTREDDLFGKRSIRSVAREALESLGGRARRADLIQAVRHKLTLAEYDDWSTAAFRRDVVSAVKSRASEDGKEAVYGIGDEVAVLRMFSVKEFETKALRIAELSKANEDSVYRLQAVCLDLHGETFNADDVLRKARAVAS